MDLAEEHIVVSARTPIPNQTLIKEFSLSINQVGPFTELSIAIKRNHDTLDLDSYSIIFDERDCISLDVIMRRYFLCLSTKFQFCYKWLQ